MFLKRKMNTTHSKFEAELESFDSESKLRDYKFMPRFVSETTPEKFLDAAVALLTSNNTEEFEVGF